MIRRWVSSRMFLKSDERSGCGGPFTDWSATVWRERRVQADFIGRGVLIAGGLYVLRGEGGLVLDCT